MSTPQSPLSLDEFMLHMVRLRRRGSLQRRNVGNLLNRHLQSCENEQQASKTQFDMYEAWRSTLPWNCILRTQNSHHAPDLEHDQPSDLPENMFTDRPQQLLAESAESSDCHQRLQILCEVSLLGVQTNSKPHETNHARESSDRDLPQPASADERSTCRSKLDVNVPGQPCCPNHLKRPRPYTPNRDVAVSQRSKRSQSSLHRKAAGNTSGKPVPIIRSSHGPKSRCMQSRSRLPGQTDGSPETDVIIEDVTPLSSQQEQATPDHSKQQLSEQLPDKKFSHGKNVVQQATLQ